MELCVDTPATIEQILATINMEINRNTCVHIVESLLLCVQLVRLVCVLKLA
jgi:hypothetical protein